MLFNFFKLEPKVCKQYYILFKWYIPTTEHAGNIPTVMAHCASLKTKSLFHSIQRRFRRVVSASGRHSARTGPSFRV